MNRLFLLIVVLISACDLHDPVNFVEKVDREGDIPFVSLSMKDAFTIHLQISDINPEHKYLDIVRKCRESDSTNLKYSDTIRVNIAEMSRVSDTIIYEDTSLYYQEEQALYYTYHIRSGVNEYNTLFYESAPIRFQIVMPTLVKAVFQEDSILVRTISAPDSFSSGIEIYRISGIDTFHQIISFNDEKRELQSLEYLSLLKTEGIPGYAGNRLSLYRDLVPNREYQYEIRSFVKKGDQTRRSPALVFDYEYTLNLPTGIAFAKNHEELRFHFPEFAVKQFDTLLIYQKENLEDSVWTFFAGSLRSDLPLYREMRICDFPGTSAYYRIVGKNANLYGIQDTPFWSEILDIQGFERVEGGMLSFIEDSSEQDIWIESFYLAKYECSQKAFEDPQQWPAQPGSLPADKLSYEEAEAFCESLNLLYPQYQFFIPSEFQWQLAASSDFRIPKVYQYPWSSDEAGINFGNYANNHESSIPGGSFSYSSPSGIFDMGGNVMEWCSTDYDNPLKDDSIWRTIKGGSYFDPLSFTECGSRIGLPESTAIPGLGFRVAMIIKGEN
jgi:hypothetical protein